MPGCDSLQHAFPLCAAHLSWLATSGWAPCRGRVRPAAGALPGRPLQPVCHLQRLLPLGPALWVHVLRAGAGGRRRGAALGKGGEVENEGGVEPEAGKRQS